MDLPVRKHPRLPSHDYTDGWYFITICTDGHKNLLSTIVGREQAPALRYQVFFALINP